jgi:hypothetical protein
MSGAEPKLRRRLLPFERNFTQIPNSWMRDGRLSYKTRGLLAMLMTHDDGFSVTLRSVTEASPKVRGEGLDGMRDAVNELEAHGYLRRHPITRRGRFLGDDWEICDPSGVNDATLFGLVDNSPIPASARATRAGTASARATRYRVGQGNAHKNTLVKNTRATPPGGSPSSSLGLDDLLTTCPDASTRAHDFDTPSGWCRWCGRVRDDGAVRDRNGEPLRPGGEPKAAEDAPRAAS